MKLVIASDLHGNLEYTEKLLKYCELKNPDQIIILGDFLHNYYRYDPFAENEVANLLNRWGAIITGIRGNTDSDNDLAKLNFPVTEDYLKYDIDGIEFYLTHGHLSNKYDYLFDDNYCLIGHSHTYNLEGKHLNPGSVGFPRRNPEHTCLYYENKTFKLINLDNFSQISQIVINK
jgi:putative phosphoesterase